MVNPATPLLPEPTIPAPTIDYTPAFPMDYTPATTLGFSPEAMEARKDIAAHEAAAAPPTPTGKLGKWEFFAAKHQMPLSADYPVEQQAYGAYQALSASERTAFDAEWEEYYYGIAPEGELGAAPPLLSQGEERILIDLQNAIEVGKMDEGQAWDIIANYWSKEETQTRRAEDATRRGETLLAGAHPGPTLPMTGPGGMGAGLQQKYGLPDLTPGVQGLPGAQALGVFGQAQQQLGLPSQLSPVEPPQFQLPNWQALGRAMPQFGGTNYIDQLLKEGRMSAPGL